MPKNDNKLKLEPKDVESLSLVADLCQQRSFVHTVEVLLEKFPERLKSAKDYFSLFMNYTKFADTYFKVKDDKGLHKMMESWIFSLQKDIETAIRTAKSPLREYLQLHYMANAEFRKNGNLAFREEREREQTLEEHKKAEKLYLHLEKNGFTPAHFIAQKLATMTYEDQVGSLKKGVQGGDPQAEIALADQYLNAVKTMDTNRLNLLEAQFPNVNDALKVIKKGIQGGNPTAISYAISIIERTASALPHLYSEGESTDPKENLKKENLKKLGDYAKELCEALELPEMKVKIQKMMTLDQKMKVNEVKESTFKEEDKAGSEPKQIAKNMAKEIPGYLKKEFERRAKAFELEAMNNLPKLVKFKLNIDDEIDALNRYIKNAEIRSATAWKYSLYQKGRQKNIQFAKDLRDELYKTRFQVSPERLPETLTKLKGKFETETSSSELNKALKEGLNNLYPKTTRTIGNKTKRS